MRDESRQGLTHRFILYPSSLSSGCEPGAGEPAAEQVDQHQDVIQPVSQVGENSIPILPPSPQGAVVAVGTNARSHLDRWTSRGARPIPPRAFRLTHWTTNLAVDRCGTERVQRVG